MWVNKSPFTLHTYLFTIKIASKCHTYHEKEVSQQILRYSDKPVNVLEQVCVDYSGVESISSYRAVLFLQASFQLISKQYICQFALAVTQIG